MSRMAVGSTVRGKHSQLSHLSAFRINHPQFIIREQFEHNRTATRDGIALEIGVLAPHSGLQKPRPLWDNDVVQEFFSEVWF